MSISKSLARDGVDVEAIDPVRAVV